MSNSYTKAAFWLRVTPAEADLIRHVITAIDLGGDDNPGEDAREACYRDAGPAFAALFPRTALDPLAGLLELFPDANYPNLGFDISFEATDENGLIPLYFSGDQFCVETAANLIQRCAPSALPFGFEFAFDCDRLRAGEFGGGYAAVTEAAITFGHTSSMLKRTIDRTLDEGADGFVLAIRNADHGLSFWSNYDGFGALARATVFSGAEAANFDLPIADDQPEWLSLPAPC